ncbi:MAG: diguanylate cyclase [Aquincola tertiaricarbonis]
MSRTIDSLLQQAWAELWQGQPLPALRRAQACLHRAGDAPNRQQRVSLLAVSALSASRLARHVEAVDHALLATAIADSLEQQPPSVECRVLALWSQGIAYGWAGCYAEAERAFESAAARAGAPDLGGDGATWLQQVHAEAMFVALVKRHDLQRGAVAAHPASPVEPLRSWPLGGFLPLGGQPMEQIREGAWLARRALELDLGHKANALDAWQSPAIGSTGDAEALLDTSDWLRSAAAWLQAEGAWARGQDGDAAALQAGQAVHLAQAGGHRALAQRAQRLVAAALQQQGQDALAAQALQALLQMERVAQAEQLADRAPAAALAMAAIHADERLDQARQETEQVRRWALEDALTGLPNLRQFEQVLHSEAARAEEGTLCVALIDVDRFKQINDSHGHVIGDDVLRAIGQLMRGHVRQHDLPARWGGDEFAILFRRSDMASAAAVAQRLEAAVSSHAWGAIAPGLHVSISIGVVQALVGDTKDELVKRSDVAMYRHKRDRARREMERVSSPVVLHRVLRWLRQASSVVLFLGEPMDAGGRQFLQVGLRERDADGFDAYWREWKRAHWAQKPTAVQRDLVELSRLLPQPVFVTERVDSLLEQAGAADVLALYGNAFRTRCDACGRLSPMQADQQCLLCGSPRRFLRPDVVLLGESPASALFARAEFALKHASVVLVVECDGSISSSTGLIEKAKARGARVVVVGPAEGALRSTADAVLPADAAIALQALRNELQSPGSGDSQVDSLSDEGFEAMNFLMGLGVDHHGRLLDEVLEWDDGHLGRRIGVMPWLFPLPTRSRIDPTAPVPGLADFRCMAANEEARAGMHRAFVRLLAFYGFAWTAKGTVERAADWRAGFAIWATTNTHHDLFFSRMLGALARCGLQAPARALLAALIPEAQRWRGHEEARKPIVFWRLAVKV